MKRQLMQALLVGSFATMAINAGAQNSTPRELPPGTTGTPGTMQNGTPQNGTPSDMSGMSRSTYPAGSTYYPSNTTSSNPQTRELTGQMRDYVDARNACSSQPMPQQEYCNNAVNRKFGSIDSKCQKVSGSALEDCLRGVDHGG